MIGRFPRDEQPRRAESPSRRCRQTPCRRSTATSSAHRSALPAPTARSARRGSRAPDSPRTRQTRWAAAPPSRFATRRAARDTRRWPCKRHRSPPSAFACAVPSPRVRYVKRSETSFASVMGWPFCDSRTVYVDAPERAGSIVSATSRLSLRRGELQRPGGHRRLRIFRARQRRERSGGGQHQQTGNRFDHNRAAKAPLQSAAPTPVDRWLDRACGLITIRL